VRLTSSSGGDGGVGSAYFIDLHNAAVTPLTLWLEPEHGSVVIPSGERCRIVGTTSSGEPVEIVRLGPGAIEVRASGPKSVVAAV